MKKYEFFLSITDSVERLIPEAYYYAALNVQSTSSSHFIEATHYDEALTVFQQSESYLAFAEEHMNHSIYTYYRDEFGDVHRADLYHPQD